jgi:hypothetical protein
LQARKKTSGGGGRKPAPAGDFIKADGKPDKTSRDPVEVIIELREALMDKALNGDLQAATIVLKCIEQETKLLKSGQDEKEAGPVVFSWLNEAELKAEKRDE